MVTRNNVSFLSFFPTMWFRATIVLYFYNYDYLNLNHLLDGMIHPIQAVQDMTFFIRTAINFFFFFF